jgi:hypothetical protein
MRYRLHLLLSLVAVCLSSCDDPNANKAKALRNEIDQLQKNIVESQQTVKRLEIQVQAAREERKKLEEDKAKAAEQKTKAEEELERMKQDFDAYKARYKVSIRNQIPGLPLGDLIVDGVTLSAAKAVLMSELSLRVSHSAGVSLISLSDLQEDTKDQLGLSQIHAPFSDPAELIYKPLTEGELAADYKNKYQALLVELKQLQNELSLAQRESQNASGLVERQLSLKGKPPIKAVEYAEALQLRYNQLAAKKALLEVEKDELYALYQAELRKLRASR